MYFHALFLCIHTYIHSAVFRNFFKGGGGGGGARLRFQEIRGGKPSWMQNLLSDLVFQGGANAPCAPPPPKCTPDTYVYTVHYQSLFMQVDHNRYNPLHCCGLFHICRYRCTSQSESYLARSRESQVVRWIARSFLVLALPRPTLTMSYHLDTGSCTNMQPGSCWPSGP